MRFAPLVLVLALGSLASLASAQGNMPKASPKASVMQQVGTASVTITYHRPAVKGRAIWGALVPYEQVWRAGANDATTIETTEEVRIAGQAVAAGTYGFFVIPKKEGSWTLILSKNPKQWGSMQYKESDDLLRLEAKPEAAPETEWLTYTITPEGKGGAAVTLQWEKVRIAFKIETDVAKAVKSAVEAAMEKTTKKDDRFYMSCAIQYYDNEIDMNQALAWIEESVKIKEGIWNVAYKGRILAKLGKGADAKAAFEKALSLAKEGKRPPTEIEEIEKWAAEAKGR